LGAGIVALAGDEAPGAAPCAGAAAGGASMLAACGGLTPVPAIGAAGAGGKLRKSTTPAEEAAAANSSAAALVVEEVGGGWPGACAAPDAPPGVAADPEGEGLGAATDGFEVALAAEPEAAADAATGGG
jgi:hypothetical protein